MSKSGWFSLLVLVAVIVGVVELYSYQCEVAQLEAHVRDCHQTMKRMSAALDVANDELSRAPDQSREVGEARWAQEEPVYITFMLKERGFLKEVSEGKPVKLEEK